jgi:hypothetical protein
MKVLSIRQPWAWLIASGRKDIENRSRRTSYRGPVFIHAGRRPPIATLADIAQKIPFEFSNRPLDLGGIVGIAEIVDCVTAHDSPWYHKGQFGFVLRNARELPFTSMRGQLNLFDAPPELLAIYRDDLAGYMASDPQARASLR